MKKKILPQKFFNRPTAEVARSLLGKFLVRRRGRKIEAYMITETEAYDGFHDKGSHASRGKTPRNAPMFGPAGRWYVYFTYGIHWMLNMVTRERGYPAAVLIRGIERVEGPAPLEKSRPKAAKAARLRRERSLTGPARLTKKLGINSRMNTIPATRTGGLWMEDRGYINRGGWIHPPSHLRFARATKGGFQHPLKIEKSPRVGIAYAGPYWAKRHLRFYLVLETPKPRRR